MRRIPPILFFASILALLAVCSSPPPAPEADQTRTPPKETSPPPQAQAAQEEEPAEQGPSIIYHSKDGATRAYLPLTSPICEEDENAQPLYEIVALWRFDADADEWSPIDVAPDVPYRISCNAMLDLIRVLGFDLDTGTYAIAAEVDGKLERDVFSIGEMSCNDVDTASAPEGKIAVCIVGESSATVQLVPDPAELPPKGAGHPTSQCSCVSEGSQEEFPLHFAAPHRLLVRLDAA
jgi:hypothetical protein